MNSSGLLLLVVLYVFFCGFMLSFCVMADPEDSEMAYLFQVALPNKLWTQLSKVCGEKKMDILQGIVDRGMVFVYLFVVLGCWTVVFCYVYPWIDQSSHVSSWHKVSGCFVFVACFGSWQLAHRSSPGIITANSFKRYDHYPYDNLLFLPNRRCESTNLIRIPRSKFDRLKYGQNVPRYDHYCGWVYNTIGENNYRWFLLFLTIHVLMCAYGSTVLISLFRGEVIDKRLLELTFFDRSTGEHVESNMMIVFQYLFSRRTLEGSVLSIMFFLGIALGAFLGYHVYITSINQTTNEAGKWGDIKRWYKQEQKKYKNAVKKGLVRVNDPNSTVQTPEVTDGDVTCTGSSQQPNAEQSSASDENQEFFDPGPIPKNIYDRGFIENWKEVLFPISTRMNALELGGYSRPRKRSQGNQTNEPNPKPLARQPAALKKTK